MTRTMFLLLVIATVTVAHAEPTVLAVDGDEIYVDLGARDGVGAGTELELLHEVVAKDPRNGAVLRDRFSLGTLTVVRSGERLSVARAEGGLGKRVLAGDRVRLRSEKRTFIDPWVARVEASRLGTTPGTVAPPPTAGQPGIDHVGLTRDAWLETLGRAPEQRITRWQQLLAADPRSPYRKVIEHELISLQAQVEQRDQALARARSVQTLDRDPRIVELAAQLRVLGAPGTHKAPLVLAPLERTVPNRPIDLSFLVRDPAAIARAWIYVRPHGAPGFHRIELTRDGDAYLRATIDAAAVRAGTLHWYVEAMSTGVDADVTPAIGSQQAPQTIEVDDEVVEAAIASGRSHIDAHVDYVDFDGKFGKGFDQYYQAEIDFTYRFIQPVYAVRLGFGTLAGVGGPKDVIDEDPTDRCRDLDGAYRCKRVNFNYVYSEVELRLRPNIALMLRPQAGLLTTDRRDGTSQNRCTGSSIDECTFATGLGGRVRVRFGEEVGTNLIVGVGFTDGVGTLLEAAYNWRPHVVVPVQLTVQVTDQPVPEDFGVRLIGDVGFRQLSWFYPSLRVSYQARDIDHAGVSGGFAMNFDW